MLSLPHTQALVSRGLLPSPSLHHPLPLISYNSSFFCPNDSALGLIGCKGNHKERGHRHLRRGYRSVWFEEGEDEEEWSNGSGSGSSGLSRFEEAVKLFNEREYYACHDLLESLWYDSYDPLRTLLHALLQCAVAFHHLFNQNHKGAMMEMGEGLCKLRKLNFKGGPFYQFEKEISAVLNFIYQTQLELAACNEDLCIAMEQTERSYQLLEGFGAGQRLYFLEQNNEVNNDDMTYIVFDPQKSYGAKGLPPTRVKLPILEVTQNHLMACENY